MDDAAALQFLLAPTDAMHRRYEAIRAVLVERRRIKDVAEQFGYQYGSLRTIVGRFRAQCAAGEPPPFSRSRRPADLLAQVQAQRGRTSQRSLTNECAPSPRDNDGAPA